MKKTLRKTLCMILACALIGLTGCDLGDLAGGFSGGSQLGDGGNNAGNNGGQTGGNDGDDGAVVPLPEIPEAPQEERVVLPQQFDFTPQAVTSQYGYRYFAGLENGEKFLRFYFDLYNACTGLTEDKDVPVTIESLTVSETEKVDVELYVLKKLDFKKYGLTQEEALAVWKTFRAEYPEFYWLNNEVIYSESLLYLQVFEEYAKGSVRALLQDKIEKMANDCHSYLSPDMSAVEMALTVYDYVILNTHYAYIGNTDIPETAIWAHNLVGIADKGKGVCETYAKAFEYLCSLIGMETITVTGQAGQTEQERYGHAWNMIKLDGVWYTVDTTWGDQEKIGFLYRDWFGGNKTEFDSTHVADLPIEYGIEWQYPLPAVAEKSISPVRMQVGDTQKVYACIDYAFADIDDEQGVYTITLHPKTKVMEAEKNIQLHRTKVVMETAVLPKADTIKFIGMLSGNDTTPLDLRSVNGVTLWSNIELKDIAWTYPTMHKNGKNILTKGFAYYLADGQRKF